MTETDDRFTAAERIATLIAGGEAQRAAVEAARLAASFPQDAEITRLHAIALFQLGRRGEARTLLQQARVWAPASVEVLCNLGSVLIADNDAAAAVRVLQQACALDSTHAAAHNGLGNALRASGDPAGARDAYAQATRANPTHPEAWLNLAAVELALGEDAQAERDSRHALTLAPMHADGLLLLGHVLAAQHRHAEAEAVYAAGAQSAPQDARFAYQCGLMADEQQHPEAAAAALARALALDPGLDHALAQLVFLRRRLCDWRGLDALSARLRTRVAAGAGGVGPFGFLAEPASAAEQLQCARTFARGIEAGVAALRRRQAFSHPRPQPEQLLRVGMIANGFGDHPTSLLIVAMVEALREHAIEIHLFSTAPADGSVLSRRLRAAAHGWHAIAGLSTATAASAIHAANIELMLDLDGYCSGSVPAVLALRPAPVQVNWLAYPGTLGADWIDYVIADRIVLPESHRGNFSEHVAWLPRCFQPSDPTRVVGVPPSRVECGLPPDAVVYVCFNNSYKINRASFERMLAVLRAVPDAVLWLLAGPDGADQRLLAEARQHGVDATRIVFMPRLAPADYLARYRHADLFLDCAPYTAHTTASDAIWAGCPLLTVAGGTFASRVAASINHHLGMAQLNVADDAAFVETAVRIGSDASLRHVLRGELAECRQRSGLFDMHAYAADFAALLRRMSQRHRAGLAATPLG